MNPSKTCIHKKLNSAIKDGRLFLIEPLFEKYNSLILKQRCCYEYNNYNCDNHTSDIITFALCKAIKYKNISVTNYLLNRNKIIHNANIYKPNNATKNLKEKLDCEANYSLCFGYAVRYGDENIFKIFLDNDLDVYGCMNIHNKSSVNPVNYALESKNEKNLGLLMKKGYTLQDSSNFKESTIFSLMHKGSTRKIKILLEYRSYPYLFKQDIKNYKFENNSYEQEKEIKKLFKFYKYRAQNMYMILAHIHDEKSLFYGSYLPKNLFNLILECANIEYHMRFL